jgi:hypothetical protein
MPNRKTARCVSLRAAALTGDRAARASPQFLRDAKQHYGIGKLLAAAALWAVQLASYNLLLRPYSG